MLTVTNCFGQRLFSKMKFIKNRLRTVLQYVMMCGLIHLALLSIECDILRDTESTNWGPNLVKCLVCKGISNVLDYYWLTNLRHMGKLQLWSWILRYVFIQWILFYCFL